MAASRSFDGARGQSLLLLNGHQAQKGTNEEAHVVGFVDVTQRGCGGRFKQTDDQREGFQTGVFAGQDQ